MLYCTAGGLRLLDGKFLCNATSDSGSYLPECHVVFHITIIL